MLGRIFASVGYSNMDDFERKKYMLMIAILVVTMAMGIILLAYALSALMH